MTTVFMICALMGGTILICQVVLLLAGMHHAGHDLHDFHAGNGAAADFACDTEVPLHSLDGGHLVHDSGSTDSFSVISFRTLAAAAAFFGMAGMAAKTSGQSVPFQLSSAVLCGVAAMYGVAWMMHWLRGLSQDGTLDIQRALGTTGTVYIPIPANHGGTGKVQLGVQNRVMEFDAVTSHGAKLPTGAEVVVVGIVSPTTLEVDVVRQTAKLPT